MKYGAHCCLSDPVSSKYLLLNIYCFPEGHFLYPFKQNELMRDERHALQQMRTKRTFGCGVVRYISTVVPNPTFPGSWHTKAKLAVLPSHSPLFCNGWNMTEDRFCRL